MKKVYLIVLTAVTVVCIVAGTFLHLGGGRSGSRGRLSGGNGSSVSDFSLGGFSSVRIDSDVARIDVVSGATSGIEAEWSDDSLSVSYEVSGGVLHVKQNGKKSVSWGNRSCSIAVTVAGNLDSLSVESSVGNVTVKDVSCGEGELSSDVGNVTVKGGSYGVLSAETDTGNIRVEDADFASCTAHSDVGNVRVKLAGGQDPAEYDVTLETDVGSVHAFGASYKHTFSQRGSGAKSIRASSDVGNVRVE